MWKPLLEEKKGLQSDVWLFSSTWSFPSAICHFVIFDTAVVAQIALVTIFFLYDTFLHTFIKFFIGFTMTNPGICFSLFMMYLEYDVFLKVFFVVIIPKLTAHFHNTWKFLKTPVLLIFVYSIATKSLFIYLFILFILYLYLTYITKITICSIVFRTID